MAMKAVVTNIDKTLNKFTVDGTITLSGNYGTSGGALPHGDTLDLTGLGVPASGLPISFWAFSTVNQGAAPQYDFYQFNPGTTQANGILQVIVGGAEMTPGAAYAGTAPTNAAGYVLHFQAEFLAF
jgi:hypothetical protein